MTSKKDGVIFVRVEPEMLRDLQKLQKHYKTRGENVSIAELVRRAIFKMTKENSNGV